MIRAVLFDLDNTLYDYDSAHKKAMKEIYKEFTNHIKLSSGEFSKLFKISRAEIHKELAGTASAHNRVLYFQRLIEKTYKTVNPTVILKLYDAYWDTLLDNMALLSGALELLKYLKKSKVSIAIVSDLTTNIQLRKLERLGISDYVDVLVTSEEAGSEKPHAIMFLLTLNKLEVGPHEAIMVGDNTIADIEGANFVGLTTVLLKKGAVAQKLKEDLQKPDYLIHKISDVKRILAKLC